MSTSVATICIRCGSKEHTTREHDEMTNPKKKINPNAAKKAAATAQTIESKLQAGWLTPDRCWQRIKPHPGIPEVLDKPFRDRFYADPCLTKFHCREPCPCKKCVGQRNKRAIELQKRLARH